MPGERSTADYWLTNVHHYLTMRMLKTLTLEQPRLNKKKLKKLVNGSPLKTKHETNEATIPTRLVPNSQLA